MKEGKSDLFVTKELVLAIESLALRSSKKARVFDVANDLRITAMIARQNDSVNLLPCGSKKSIKEIIKLNKLSASLRKHIKTMHKDTLDLFRHLDAERYLPDLDLIRISTFLSDINTLSVEFVEKLERIPHVPHTGRREKRHSQAITDSIVRAYEELTGREATVSNPEYKVFAKAVQAAVNLDPITRKGSKKAKPQETSPINQLRTAKTRRKKL